MTLRDARVVGDQVKCWHCPCTLGQIVPSVDGGFLMAAQPFYRRAKDDPIPGSTVLLIPRHVRERIARTGLPVHGKPKLDKDGKMVVLPSAVVAMPVLLPCWRPGCGESNRVATSLAAGV